MGWMDGGREGGMEGGNHRPTGSHANYLASERAALYSYHIAQLCVCARVRKCSPACVHVVITHLLHLCHPHHAASQDVLPLAPISDEHRRPRQRSFCRHALISLGAASFPILWTVARPVEGFDLRAFKVSGGPGRDEIDH